MLCDDSLSAAAMSNQFKNTSSSTWDVQEGGNSTPPPSFQFELEPVVISVNPWDIVLCVTGTLMSCENAIVLALIIYTPTLKAPMFVLIGSLAFADLLAGLGLIVNFTITYIFDTGFVTLLSAGLLITAFSASVLNILAITVDRYLSLYNALTYHTERTVIFTFVTLVLIWVTSITLGALPIMGWNCLEDETTCSICAPIDKNHAAALAVTFLFVFALILQLYLQICKIAFRHAQQIAVQQKFMTTSHSSSPTTKGVSTLSIILGTFALCWIPFAMYSLVADIGYPPIYTYVTALPAICHSMINPIIYAFRNPDIQKSMRIACCCGCAPSNFSLRPRTPSDV
ncbi:G-protein coupled receptor 12-like [Salmo salar]|uniref:G-protein coupled receptor 12-like n=1 Tax=Salmo salar TaxID=8030 RepID=A0A1S3RGQ8_SALSA|nr:G-protein coupled receptor 12-like [Salmo salar]|eukprot:XP_014051480.1 PREDICTED: G-protein coupled receptor 12-like [Salmo salar]